MLWPGENLGQGKGISPSPSAGSFPDHYIPYSLARGRGPTSNPAMVDRFGQVGWRGRSRVTTPQREMSPAAVVGIKPNEKVTCIPLKRSRSRKRGLLRPGCAGHLSSDEWLSVPRAAARSSDELHTSLTIPQVE